MDIKEIAALVAIRNHIAFLINNDRLTIPKDKVREASGIQTKLDRLIYTSVEELYGPTLLKETEKVQATVEEPVVEEAVVEKPPPVSQKTVDAKVAAQEDEELAKRLAEAKKALKKTPKKPKASAKRTDTK